MKNVRSEVRLRRSEKRLSEVRLRRSGKRLSEEGYGEVKTFVYRMLRRRDECLKRKYRRNVERPGKKQGTRRKGESSSFRNMKNVVDERQRSEEENSRSFAPPSAALPTTSCFFLYYKLFCVFGSSFRTEQTYITIHRYRTFGPEKKNT